MTRAPHLADEHPAVWFDGRASGADLAPKRSMTAGPVHDKARRGRLIAWVAREILPHEPTVRAWLRQQGCRQEDADDLVQKAYAGLSVVSDPDQIARPSAYFLEIVRDLYLDLAPRAQPVATASILKTAPLTGPQLEATIARQDPAARILHAVDGLPQRCRDILEMRKTEHLPQRVIAQRLGLSGDVVENETAKGLGLVVQTCRGESPAAHTGKGEGS